MRKKKEEKEANNERWLLTYSDLITLLMVFFVVLYSMSNIDAKKYAQLASSMNAVMGSGGKNMLNTGGGTSSNPIDAAAVPQDVSDAEKAENKNLEETAKKVKELMAKSGMGDSVTAEVQQRGLVISVKDSVFFDSGKAEIRAESEKKMVEIGKLISALDNYIIVEGNTDDVPISNYMFADNWDLAASRANNVLRLLVNKGGINIKMISARSNGEYRPRVPNDSDTNKALNRRVDIVVLYTKFNKTESGNK